MNDMPLPPTVAFCRDEQLAKFEAYLNKEDCLHINALTRSRSRMAYPMKG